MPPCAAGMHGAAILAAISLQACVAAGPTAMSAAFERGDFRLIAEVSAMAEGRYLGRVIEAELEPKGLAWAYEISSLPPQGTPFEVTLDARTGAFPGAERLVQERVR